MAELSLLLALLQDPGQTNQLLLEAVSSLENRELRCLVALLQRESEEVMWPKCFLTELPTQLVG